MQPGGGIHRLADALHLPVGVDERPVLLGVGGGRQDDVGQLRGFREEQLVDHEEVQGLERLDHAVGVRVGGGRVVADDVSRPHPLPSVACVPGYGERQPLRGGKRAAPGFLELRPHARVVAGLVAGQDIGQGPQVASALNVVLAAQGIDAGPLRPTLPVSRARLAQPITPREPSWCSVTPSP